MSARDRLARAAGRHELLTATAVLGGIALLWMWPLLLGEELGQSFQLFDAMPWRGLGADFDRPDRYPLLDAALAFEPWASVAREQLHAGQVPLWNPYEYGGTTLVGNMQSALFFPLTWLVFVAPLDFAWGLIALGKVVIAGVGTYGVARELRVGRAGALLAGAVFMLAGPLTFWLQWPLATGFAVFPWLVWASTRCVRRRTPGAVAGMGAATGLTLLAGHPETAVIAVSAAGVFAAALTGFERRPLRSLLPWMAGVLLGTALAAVSILPFLEALGPSATLGDREVPMAAPSPASLLGLGMPGLFGDGEPALYGWPFGYFGLPAAVLALVALFRLRARADVRALAVTVLLVLLAVFRIPPVSWLLELVPPWSVTYINDQRTYFVLALAGAVGAGAAAEHLRRRPMSQRRAWMLVGSIGLALALALGVAEASNSLAAPASVKWGSVIVTLGLLAMSLAVLVALGRLGPRWAGVITLAACLLGLGGLQNLNVFLPSDEARPPRPPAIESLQRQPGSPRIITLRGQPYLELPNNTAVPYRLESIEGYDFPLSRRWADFQDRVLGFTGPEPLELKASAGPPRPPALRALRMMNVGAYIAAPGTPAPPGLRPVYSGRDAVVFRDPLALPRAYVVPTSRGASDEQALETLATGRLDPRREALVPPGAARGTRGARFAPARTEQPSPDHVRVRVPSGSSGWLVLANAYSPSWKAEVDGKEVPLEPTNSVAMGVALPEGAQTVDFRLDRTVLYLGAAISGVALLVIALLGLSGLRRRRPRARRQPPEAEARAAP